MIWSIAWRNIWRNKLRSFIILTAIAIGIFAGVFSWAFYAGMLQQRINSAIKTEASHIQIHRNSYLSDPELKKSIPNGDSLSGIILDRDEVEAVSARLLINGMILSAHTGTGVKVSGIEPEDEKKVTNLYQKVVKGSYFEGKTGNPIVIGAELADKLNIDIRSKVVLYLQDTSGTMLRSQFRVSGIFSTTNAVFEETNVFIRQEDMRKLIQLPKHEVHELAVLLKNNELTQQLTDQLHSELSSYDVKSWREIMPDVSLVEESFNISMYVFLIIILLALCFGIVNTMLMAVLERYKELGMLMAIGMNKWRVFKMIVLETILLSLTGGVAGIIIASVFTMITHHTGVDLSRFSEAYKSIGYESIVYPMLRVEIVVQVSILVILAGLLSSLYPAYKALKLKPTDALRIDV